MAWDAKTTATSSSTPTTSSISPSITWRWPSTSMSKLHLQPEHMRHNIIEEFTSETKSWNSSLPLTDNRQSCIHLYLELHLQHLEHYQTSNPTNNKWSNGIRKKKHMDRRINTSTSTKYRKEKYLNKTITWRAGRNLQFNIHYTTIL